MEHTWNSKTTFHICIYAHFFTDRAIFCVKLTQIYEIYTNLLSKEASWSKSQISKHIYTLFSMDDRWKLPKRDITFYREGLLYKCQTGKSEIGAVDRAWSYFVKMSFWYICALTSHFVNFCEFEFQVFSIFHIKYVIIYNICALFCAQVVVLIPTFVKLTV